MTAPKTGRVYETQAEMDVEKDQPRTFWGVVKEVFNWYPSHYPAEERKLLFKLDLSILIFACLCCEFLFLPPRLCDPFLTVVPEVFTKYLDQSNISNAYTSGMKEDLGLYGNELNYFNVAYFTAYVIAQIPMLLLISRPKLYVRTLDPSTTMKEGEKATNHPLSSARYMLPTLEIAWGVLTFAQSRVTSARQLYALRFFVGLFEAPVFAGTHFILGSWYRKEELFKRAGTWFICNSLGTMVSGYLQAAAYTNLSDGIFTLPVALAGFVIFPGIPESPKPVFLSHADVALAKERMAEEKVRPPGKLGLDVFKRSLRRWHIYVFVFCYVCMIISSYPTSYMNLWLKAEHYTVPQINKLPTALNAVNIVSSWLGTALAGSVYPAWAVYSVAMAACVFASACMTVWRVPVALK
ncbi:hypothetical protein SLS58_005083 [Diplodia intermedia]|uniref:Major facilitator superfamily transporter n=1 Tax=Diplodia intermedia TaxID=856260 RepID=A0ABR3TRW5_9PEZI